MKVLLFTFLSLCTLLGGKEKNDPFKLKKESEIKQIQQREVSREKTADVTLTAVINLKNSATAVIKKADNKKLFLAVGDKFSAPEINQGPFKEWRVKEILAESVSIVSESGKNFTLKFAKRRTTP